MSRAEKAWNKEEGIKAGQPGPALTLLADQLLN